MMQRPMRMGFGARFGACQKFVKTDSTESSICQYSNLNVTE
jgi:hypothetical protein